MLQPRLEMPLLAPARKSAFQVPFTLQILKKNATPTRHRHLTYFSCVFLDSKSCTFHFYTFLHIYFIAIF